MKTSFYFFLWIIIYPLLGLTHNPWIYQNSFIVALIIVWVISWFLNKNMPDTLRYERVSETASMLEEIYVGNVDAFRKRLSRRVTIDFVTAIYLGVAFIFVLFSMVRGNTDDWIALLIFGFFAFGTLSSAVKLNHANNLIKNNPTPEECARVVSQVYRVDYNSYYSRRQYVTPESMLPTPPKHFKSFQVVSLIIAIICCLFGLFYLINSIIILSENRSAEAISGGIMYFLYGSLAAYFGIKDSATCIAYFKRSRNR